MHCGSRATKKYIWKQGELRHSFILKILEFIEYIDLFQEQ